MFAERGGRWPAFEFVRGLRHIQALLEKLREEADEVARVPLNEGLTAKARAELLEEIADTREVLDALCRSAGITEAEVLEGMREKRERNGGFDAGVLLKEAA